MLRKKVYLLKVLALMYYCKSKSKHVIRKPKTFILKHCELTILLLEVPRTYPFYIYWRSFDGREKEEEEAEKKSKNVNL